MARNATLAIENSIIDATAYVDQYNQKFGHKRGRHGLSPADQQGGAQYGRFRMNL